MKDFIGECYHLVVITHSQVYLVTMSTETIVIKGTDSQIIPKG